MLKEQNLVMPDDFDRLSVFNIENGQKDHFVSFLLEYCIVRVLLVGTPKKSWQFYWASAIETKIPDWG